MIVSGLNVCYNEHVIAKARLVQASVLNAVVQ